MPRVTVTGAAGQLGRQLVEAFEAAGHEVRGLSHADLDITAGVGLAELAAWRPGIVVNAAAWTDVDGCARDPDRAMRVNGEAAGRVAEVAADVGALIVQVSTNEVFDGTADRPYRPGDEPSPVNAYGRSKLAGERAVAAANPRHLIVRTAWLFGPGGTNFVTKVLAAASRAAAGDAPVRLVTDETGNPTWAPDLAAAIVALVARAEPGAVLHAAGTPPATRLEWGTVALEAAGVAVAVEPVPLSAFERASTPPPRAVLAPSPEVATMDWRPPTREYARQLAARR